MVDIRTEIRVGRLCGTIYSAQALSSDRKWIESQTLCFLNVEQFSVKLNPGKNKKIVLTVELVCSK